MQPLDLGFSKEGIVVEMATFVNWSSLGFGHSSSQEVDGVCKKRNLKLESKGFGCQSKG